MPFGLRAASTARRTASTIDPAKALISSSAVTGSRWPRIVATFSPLARLVPRSPWRVAASQPPYRTQKGSFRCSLTSS